MSRQELACGEPVRPFENLTGTSNVGGMSCCKVHIHVQCRARPRLPDPLRYPACSCEAKLPGGYEQDFAGCSSFSKAPVTRPPIEDMCRRTRRTCPQDPQWTSFTMEISHHVRWNSCPMDIIIIHVMLIGHHVHWTSTSLDIISIGNHIHRISCLLDMIFWT